MAKKYIMVEAQALPPVYGLVLEAKELLASGEARNISAAAKQVGISRSAFYKYKDHVFNAGNANEIVTLLAVLKDQTGALQTLLTAISEAGASVVTINQSRPENGTAQVEVNVRTATMRLSMDDLITRLERSPVVVQVYRTV